MKTAWNLSARAASLLPSTTLQIDAKAKDLKRRGVDVVNFGVGEPDFDTPAPIAEAAVAAIRAGKTTKYTPAGGIPELRAAIAEKLRRENGLEYSPAEVLAAAGTKQALHDVLQVLLSPADEVLIFSPYWVSYPELVKLSGGVPVFVPTSPTARPLLDALRKAVTPRTVGILCNSPNNPAGTVYTRGEIEGIARIALERDLWILSDEVYEKLVFGGAAHISAAHISAESKARTFIVNAVSKTYGMTGWRLGYLAGPKEVIAAAESVQGHATGNPSTAAQFAALSALTGDQGMVSEMVAEYDRRRQTAVGLLGGIPGFECPLPDGAFYAFPKVAGVLPRRWKGKPIGSSLRLAQVLLEEAHVAVVPGSAFGTEGYLRLSYATSLGQIEKGIGRIRNFVEGLS